MFKRKNIKVEIALILIVFASMLITTMNKKKTSEYIKRDYIVSTGKIVKYYPRGTEVSRRIEYTYSIDDKEYNRRIDVDYHFEICEDFDKCKQKRYWVICSKESPEYSLINLKLEIQGAGDLEFPDSLADFE